MMLLYCFFAIFVSVQYALQVNSEVETFDLKDVAEELKKGVMHSQYGRYWKRTTYPLQNLAGVTKRSDPRVHLSYVFGHVDSEDFRALVRDVLLPYLREKTCLEFHEISRNEIDSVDGRFFIIFMETQKTLANCFELIHHSSYVTLNKECVRQKVKDRRDGKTDSRMDLSKLLNDKYCIADKMKE